MEIFIVQNGKKKGPFTRYQIREKLANGEFSGETQGWMRGEENWAPLREIPATLALIQEIEREKLDAKLARDPGPTLPPEPTVPPSKLSSHAIARFGARMFDIILFQTIALYFFAPEPVEVSDWEHFRRILSGDQTEQEADYFRALQKIGLASVFAWHLVEWVFVAIFGATLGKFLFNLRVLDAEDRRPKPATCLYRSILVWMLGMAAGLPVFQFLANFLAFLRVQSRGVTNWDALLHTQVTQGRMTFTRLMLIFGMFVLLVAANRLIG